MSTVSIFHVLVTGPSLLYIGLNKPENPLIYTIALLSGILLGLFFVFKLYIQKYDSPWLKLHLAIFVPLLILLGIRGRQSPPFLFSVLTAIGCAAIGYHGIKIVNYISSS